MCRAVLRSKDPPPGKEGRLPGAPDERATIVTIFCRDYLVKFGFKVDEITTDTLQKVQVAMQDAVRDNKSNLKKYLVARVKADYFDRIIEQDLVLDDDIIVDLANMCLCVRLKRTYEQLAGKYVSCILSPVSFVLSFDGCFSFIEVVFLLH